MVKKKGQRLSLSVNSDFAGTLKALQKHHSDNWVGASLEAVWKKMAEIGSVFAFELWLHDPTVKEPRLIAADFGHPHTQGLVYYVTTRFFDREFRGLQPGFILAFAEAEVMRRAGFELWDLGGADKSPMMSYKPQVAIEMGRSAFLRRLRECRVRAKRESLDANGADGAGDSKLPVTDPRSSLQAGGSKIPTGVAVEEIGEENLWGAVTLQKQEAELKAAQDAARKAAMKVQKPPKAERKAARSKANENKDSNQKVDQAGYSAPAAPAATPAATPEVAANSNSSAGAVDAKAAAQQRFRTVFQELLTKGMPQSEAAAEAIRIVSCQ